MRIVILGAGTVGSSIAALCCREGHSVTVVDSRADHSARLNDTLDLKALTGSASQSSVLFSAGAMQADLVLAVTGNDEVNLIAASMSKAMGARRVVARVYAPVYHDLSTFDYTRHFQIDRLLSLEQLSAMQLARSIRQSGAVAVESFARGALEMREFVVRAKAAAADTPLKELGLPRGVRVGTILRNEVMKIAEADDVLAADDRITLVGRRDDIDQISDRFQNRPASKQGVVIAGGGETGLHLARILESGRFTVVLMEADAARCEFLASTLHHTTVINSDATRRDVLEEERVGSADVFVACTGDDENNILACVEAREIGTSSVMAIVGRPDYANLMGKLGIDRAVSPRDVTAQQVLGFLNEGPVISRTDLTGGEIVVLEIEVLPDSPATEHVLAVVDFPAQCLIAAVMREDSVRVPGADDHLRPGDTVVALVDRAAVDDTLKLFEVDA